jgi:hypothetical protein
MDFETQKDRDSLFCFTDILKKTSQEEPR